MRRGGRRIVTPEEPERSGPSSSAGTGCASSAAGDVFLPPKLIGVPGSSEFPGAEAVEQILA
jgi:hypothetical protein